MTTSSSERRGLNITLPQVLTVLALVFGISVISSFTEKMEKSRSIRAEASRLRTQVTDLVAEQEALKVTQVYIESDAFLENEAHSRLKYVKSGETIVLVVNPAGAVPAPNPVATRIAPTPEIESWHVWWEMFFAAEE